MIWKEQENCRDVIQSDSTGEAGRERKKVFGFWQEGGNFKENWELGIETPA